MKIPMWLILLLASIANVGCVFWNLAYDNPRSAAFNAFVGGALACQSLYVWAFFSDPVPFED